MGGDWYDVIALDDHRYALIVGDVAGHGITAVGDMAQLRAVISALVRLGSPLGEVFSQATILLQASDHNPTASSLLAIVDSREGSVAYAVAGHPPPLVRMPDGEVVSLMEGRQPILGVTVSATEGAGHPFPPGATLVAYTDGLIERRGESIDKSIERLQTHLGSAPEGAVAVADHLLEQCLSGYGPADDIALVVIRHLP
jgi:serine phosphatase RsbU (regulator of sigma subunit)